MLSHFPVIIPTIPNYMIIVSCTNFNFMHVNNLNKESYFLLFNLTGNIDIQTMCTLKEEVILPKSIFLHCLISLTLDHAIEIKITEGQSLMCSIKFYNFGM